MKPEVLKPVFDVGDRAQFPILKELVHGKPLVYFDNAATSQKPRRVIRAETRLLRHDQRQRAPGVHTLSTKGHRGAGGRAGDHPRAHQRQNAHG